MDSHSDEILKKTIVDWLNMVYRQRLETLIDHKIAQLEKEFDQRVLVAIAKKFFEPTQVSVEVKTQPLGGA